MISLFNIEKVYNEQQDAKTVAVDGLDLDISKGEFIAIMGPSGCGKSTLLNILGCMDQHFSGEYWLEENPVHSMSQKELHALRKKYISFVFQNFALLDEYTVYENTELPLLARKVKRAARRRMVLKCLDAVGLKGMERKYPRQLSGGQQQRVAIARALVCQTKILLADEPTGALDRANSFKLMELLRRIHETGKTIIVVTHDPKIAAYADRIIVMEDGTIREERIME